MNQITNPKRRHFLSTGGALAATAMLPQWAFAQDADTFRLGSLNSITGIGGPYGPAMLESIRLAVDEVNGQGGAAGKKIVLFSEDDQTKADVAVLAAKKLIEINRVQAVVGIWPSAVGLAVMPITNNAGLIMMNTCGAPEMQTENKRGLAWMFQASNAVFGKAFAEVARRRGFKRPAVMAFNNSTFVGLADYFKKTWEAGGDRLAELVIYEPNQTSYRTELNKVLAKKPDVIAMGSYKPDATILLKEWFQTGQECKFIMPGWTANKDLVKAIGKEATEGIISISNVANTDSPAYQSYAQRIQAKLKREPDVFAAQSYDMVVTLALAMEAAGRNADTQTINNHIKTVTQGDGEKVSSFSQGKEILRKGGKINYEGASSALNFGAHGETVPDFGVFEIQNGELVRKETIPGSA
ncbi:ABC transporter substrate-binding protein [Pusillimonas sp. TS35]|uniref:ABC transporter substrate-binding protein n=1 Tax=Paracandidimonas lactea TaxID=2895524 RepID=UPI001368F65D|nr:ABC transporter substrate-binding protein [Paracandidimonas lactea]MYN13065.1 ABC transporter substrate-binding protein [Pusillimonas sp. TS35]